MTHVNSFLPACWTRIVLLLVLLLQSPTRTRAKLRFPSLIKAKVDSNTCPPDATLEEIAAGICEHLYANTNSKPTILPKAVMELPLQIYVLLKKIVLYQPPVGIVAAWVLTRLLTSGRIFGGGELGDASEQALVSKASRLDRHSGRALDLDKDDLEYQKFGGIERVRGRLIHKTLTDKVLLVEEDATRTSALISALVQLLVTSFPPGGSHSDHVHQLLAPMAQVEQQMHTRILRTGTRDLDRILELGSQTAEVRILDAMLRLTRDRLLRTSFRLSRTVKHWRRRVQTQSVMLPIVRRMLKDSFEGDRMRLAFAEAAYHNEMVRLGKVVSVLMDRPNGMDDSALALAVQKTLDYDQQHNDDEICTSSSSWSLPKISNFALRFNVDGRGKFQFQTYEKSLTVGGNGALDVLMMDYETAQKEWLQQAGDWSMQARGMLYEIVEESLKTSIQPTMQAQLELKKLGSAWCFKEYANPNDIPQCWTQLYEHIRDLHQLRRVGEGKSVKWKDANFVHWFRQYDLLGIPSAWLKVYLASLLHYKILPHWPKIQNFILGSWEIVYEIVTRRFWTPVKDLLTELMYRPNTQLLTGIALTDEETSLDFMLRDLGFGDGKPENRHEAINKATRQYESDMNTGLLRHAMGGRLIRLILIQVQQLKVGMLHAADTVDVLLQANRFNFQLLAIIPAIVIVTVGTKVFFRFLFTLRVKDLRPMSSVHAEMTEYLNGLESVLLLADKNSANKDDAANQVLTHREMGEFVLTLYDYLVLLDYSSPQPFPSWQSDRIHQSIVEFLGPQGSLTRLGLDDHLQLIDQVKRKHQELAKNL